jgi:hypothetical protein
MDKISIDREAVYKTAKLIAGKFGVKCDGNMCKSCNKDCMCLEFAQKAISLGYKQTKSHVKNNMMKSAPFVGMTEELSKPLASSRGYGCNDQDCCLRCSCCWDCIPRDIASHLIQNGYRKESV